MTNQMTAHAQVRMQQRGIPANVIDCLLAYGRRAHDHLGAVIVYFDHHARNKLRKTVGEAVYRQLAEKLSTYAVLGSNGAVVTVGHRTKSITRH